MIFRLLLVLALQFVFLHGAEISSDEEMEQLSSYRRIFDIETPLDLLLEECSKFTPLGIFYKASTLASHSFYTVCPNCVDHIDFRQIWMEPGVWEKTMIMFLISTFANLAQARLHLTHHRFVNISTAILSAVQIALILQILSNGDVTGDLWLDDALVILSIFIPLYHYAVLAFPRLSNALRRLA